MPCVSLGSRGHISDISAILKQEGKNVFRVVRFDTVTLFSFDSPLNFLKSWLVMHYVACSFLPAWHALGSEKCPWFSSNVWFDPDSSIKLL